MIILYNYGASTDNLSRKLIIMVTYLCRHWPRLALQPFAHSRFCWTIRSNQHCSRHLWEHGLIREKNLWHSRGDFHVHCRHCSLNDSICHKSDLRGERSNRFSYFSDCTDCQNFCCLHNWLDQQPDREVHDTSFLCRAHLPLNIRSLVDLCGPLRLHHWQRPHLPRLGLCLLTLQYMGLISGRQLCDRVQLLS